MPTIWLYEDKQDLLMPGFGGRFQSIIALVQVKYYTKGQMQCQIQSLQERVQSLREQW